MEDFIVIPFDRFKELYDGSAESHGSFITTIIEDLKSRFSCLTAIRPSYPEYGGGGGGAGGRGAGGSNERGGGGHWGNSGHHRRHGRHGGGHGGHGGGARRADRPRIGIRELSREDISRKDFTANMNKLSRQNYDSILRLIRTTYNSNFLPNYMDIIWSMMVRQPDFQDLHIQVIQHLLTITPPERKAFVQTYWSDRCQAYFQEKGWTPTDELLSSASQEEYDEFCDYIKWKKTTGASLLAWLRLMEHKVIPMNYELCFQSIVESIHAAFRQHLHKFAECLLEWFLQMSSLDLEDFHFPDDTDFILNDWLQIIKERGLSSCLKFKIMDVRERIHHHLKK